MGLFEGLKASFWRIWGSDALENSFFPDAIIKQRIAEVVFAAFFVVVIIGAVIYLKNEAKRERARVAAKTSPTYENVMEVCRLMAPKGVTIVNKPEEWGKWRDMFYVVNGSSQVPTELKQKLKAILSSKGLYLGNMKIIDNYKQK